MLPPHTDECDGLNKNGNLTDILLFSVVKRKQIMILNLHTHLNQVEKRAKNRRTVNFLTNADE